MTKHIVTLAVAFAAMASIAHAGTGAAPPVVIHGAGMSVIANSGTRPITLVQGDNPIDEAHVFNCKSARGCVAILSASIAPGDTIETQSCTYVDGVAATPCTFDGISGGRLVIRSQSVVGPGRHTVQTIVHADITQGQILAWEVDYMIFERAVR
jgi:hypothetical protein